MKTFPILALPLVLAAGCCTQNVPSVADNATIRHPSSSVKSPVVQTTHVSGEIGGVSVSAGTLVLDKGTDNGVGRSRIVTVCAVVVTKERTRLVPVATAEVAPSKTTSILNLRTANVRDEDGDLIVREFRANPIRYAETHRLIAVAGTVSDGGLVVSELDRGTVIQSSIIKE